MAHHAPTFAIMHQPLPSAQQYLAHRFLSGSIFITTLLSRYP
jgi:hypothetical protein